MTPPVADVLSTRDLLRVAPVRNLFVANSLVYAGIAMQGTALAKHVFDLTGRELDLAMIGLAEFVPSALLVLVSGTVADRFDRRRITGMAIIGELAVAVALMGYSLSTPGAVWPFFAIALAYGVARAFMAPASRALPPMVAPEGSLPRVLALFSATWTGSMIVGPALSGVLYSISTWVPYAVAAATMLAGFVFLNKVTLVNPPEPVDLSVRPTVRSAMEGLRFIARTPMLLAAISLDLFAVLFGGAVALLPVIAEERLGVGNVAYGWLRAAPGIGAAVVAILLASRPIRRRVGPWLFAAVATFGVATVVLGLTRSYTVAFVSLIVLSGADMISVFVRSTLVPLLTPDEKRGRVLAVENVFIGASNELGAFESGVAAHLIGTPATVIGGGVATIVVVAVWSVIFPTLRKVDRFEQLTEDHPGGER